MIKKSLKLTFAALLVTGALAACGQTTDNKTNTATPAPKQEISGTITAAGSTALQPLAEEAATAFMAANPKVSITIQGGGSGTGINQVASGAIQIGNSDVTSASKLDADKAKELTDTKVAGIAFAVVVNKDVEVTNLTTQQIQDIFSGKVTNWKDVGGKDAKINVINRPASSGTRATFEKTLLKGTKANDSIGTAQDANGSVETAVNSTSGSISYLAMSYLVGDKKGALKTLQIDGVDATTENIAAGKYPFWSYEYMITKGAPADANKAFIDYIAGKDFEKKVTDMGYIPMTKLNK